jgi:hypothetical protein
MTLAWLIFMAALPVLATITAWELVLPTAVLTERLFGVRESCGRGSANPAHPEVQVVAARTNAMTIGTNTLFCPRRLIRIEFSVVASSFSRM